MDEYTKQRLEDFKDQINRVVSHVESEQDRVNELSKRVDMVKSSADHLRELVNKLDDIIRNGGKGLVGRIGNIERDQENNDKSWHRWAAVIGGLSGVAALVIEIIRK